MEDFSKLTKQELIERLSKKSSESEDEMSKLNRLSAKSNPSDIPVFTQNDHKNVMLYTAINKRVGPLHPENAKRTMEKFRRAGVQLYVTKRTDEQVEAFKQTDEYKKAFEAHQKLRAKRHEDSKKGSMERFATEIAKATAQAVATATK